MQLVAPDGTWLQINRAGLELVEIEREEDAVGHSFFDYVAPGDLERVTAFRQRVLAGENGRIEFDIIGRRGTQRHVESTAVPMADPRHKIIELSVIRDVTTRRQGEIALRSSEERLRILDQIGQVTRSATDPAIVMEATARLIGDHLGVNRCAYADVDPDHDRFLIRHDWTTPGLPSSVGCYSLQRFGPLAVAQLRAGRTLVIHDVEKELVDDPGRDAFRVLRIQAVICCPLVKDQQLVAMMAVHQSWPRTWTTHEISLLEEVVDRSWAHIERIRASDSLREQDRRKDEFLAILAHELRNPLAPLRNGLQVLRLAREDTNLFEKSSVIMERQLSHMVRLIDDLLDISRISQGKFTLQMERVPLTRILQQSIETSRPLIDQQQQELTVEWGPDNLFVNGDVTRLSQVFANLLNNAAKYTEPGGKIHIVVEPVGPMAVIRLRDTGIGIPPHMLASIFDMFTQVEHAGERTQGGLGIGLSLVKGMVELHGGHVSARSEGAGQGSEFVVRLPLLAELPLNGTAHMNGARRDQPALHRILVVDDNRDAAITLSMMLSLLGHETRTAHDGLEALPLARDFQPDVVLLDIGMPYLDGYETCRRLRQHPGGSDLIILALTGWGQEADKRRSFEAGFNAHLVKPVDPRRLTSFLDELQRPEPAALHP